MDDNVESLTCCSPLIHQACCVTIEGYQEFFFFFFSEFLSSVLLSYRMCKEEGDLLCRRPLDRLCYRGQGKPVSNRRSLRWGPRNAAILHKVTVFCTQLLLCKDCANVYKAGGNSKAASQFSQPSYGDFCIHRRTALKPPCTERTI